MSRVSKAGNPYNVARLAVYNVGFDGPRLEALFGTQFTPWDRRVRDVLQRVYWYFDRAQQTVPPENFKLTTVAKWFGVTLDGDAHDALFDARLCALLSEQLDREADGGF